MDSYSSTSAYGSILVPAGSLPFALLHGESLAACAAWSLGEAEVTLLDDTLDWPEVGALIEVTEAVLVLHDALCPATPPGFIADCVATAAETEVVVAGVRPVTDTVKESHHDPAGEWVGATLDRDELAQVTSPIVLPAAAVAIAARLWPGGPAALPSDPAQIVSELAARIGVHLATAPEQGRRVESVDEVAVLEAVTAPVG